MHASHPHLRPRAEIPFLSVLLISGAAALLSITGCQSPEVGATPQQASAKPNFGPPVQDVRTEAKLVELENWYTAEKNSQPTHQHEVEAEAARKRQEQEKQAKEKAAQPPAKPNP